MTELMQHQTARRVYCERDGEAYAGEIQPRLVAFGGLDGEGDVDDMLRHVGRRWSISWESATSTTCSDSRKGEHALCCLYSIISETATVLTMDVSEIPRHYDGHIDPLREPCNCLGIATEPVYLISATDTLIGWQCTACGHRWAAGWARERAFENLEHARQRSERQDRG